MSQFEGGHKVRCSDCIKLLGSQCSVKQVKVSSKKRRTCSKYVFKGEYENNTPLPSTYIPHVDKKTRNLLRRLAKMGVMPLSGERPIVSAGPYKEDEAPVGAASFKSTATAVMPTVGPFKSGGSGDTESGNREDAQ